jgi:hypothetical protein
MNLSPRDRRALLIGAVGLAAVALVAFALIPMARGWSDAREQIRQSRQVIERQSAQMAQVLEQQSRLKRQFGSAATQPVAADEPTAQRNLYETAQSVLKSGGLNVTGYEPQRPRRLSQLGDVAFMPLQVRGKCNTEQLTKCLAGLRQAKTLVVVDRLSVTSDPKQPDQLDVTMVLCTLVRQGRSRP